MATVLDAKRRERGFHWPPTPVTVLATLLLLLVIGALQGGLAMVINPVTPLGMSTEYLEVTPVADYFWPGVFLLAIAAASALTAVGLLVPWRWRWASRIESAIGYRWPLVGAVSTGTVLLVFEVIELFMVPFHPIMHPLLIAWSLLIVVLTLTPPARLHLMTK